jgi:hypothetical protein
MPETNDKPQDPMQAVAYAQIMAIELGQDAREQAGMCQQGVGTLTSLADTLAKLAMLLQQPARGAVDNVADVLRRCGITFGHVGERFAAHAEGWEREQKVWQAIMDGAAPAPTTEKTP